MKGRICAIAVTLATLSSAVYSQTVISDLGSTSMGCFKNAIDWTAGPNEKFNTLAKDYILGGLDFTGGGIGYYKSGAMPLAIKGQLTASKDVGETVSDVTTIGGKTSYTHPVFNNFAFNVNATVGLPSVSDLSVGLDLWTAQYDNGSVTTPPAGAPTTTVVKSGSCTLGVPFGMRFLNGYNYALVQFSTNWNKTDTVDQSMWHVYLYDKFKFASILPGGTWTAITASVTSPHRSTLTSTDTITTGTIGILNRFDVPVVDGVTLALIPQVSLSETATFDAPATGSTSSSFNTALDIGMAMAVKATIPGTPITLSAGIKPIATINLIGSSSTTIVGAFTSTVNSFDNSIGYAANNNALFCITVAFPEDVSMDLEVVNANTYAFECVIPLKPSPAPEPKAAPARKQAAKETPKKAEKPAAQPASQAAAKPANKAAPKKN